MLNLSNVSLSSPPSLVQLAPYRPAVSFTNSGDVVAYVTGSLVIVDKTTGLTVFSDHLSCNPVPPGATSTALCSRSWTPVIDHTYSVSASLFAGNAADYAAARLSAVPISGPSAEPPAALLAYVPIPAGARAMVIQFDQPITDPKAYGALPFGRIMDPKEWPPPA